MDVAHLENPALARRAEAVVRGDAEDFRGDSGAPTSAVAAPVASFGPRVKKRCGQARSIERREKLEADSRAQAERVEPVLTAAGLPRAGDIRVVGHRTELTRGVEAVAEGDRAALG